MLKIKSILVSLLAWGTAYLSLENLRISKLIEY